MVEVGVVVVCWMLVVWGVFVVRMGIEMVVVVGLWVVVVVVVVVVGCRGPRVPAVWGSLSKN